jgi:citrate lyase alpha subunit
LFARIEGLIGEERALLDIPAAERRPEHVERLREVAHELDRIWEMLRERAERRAGRPEATP